MKAAKHFSDSVIYSWQKLGIPNSQFDELRHEHPNTVFIVIFKQNGEGGTRGGVTADYDAPVSIRVKRVDETFERNYAVFEKNRGNGLTAAWIISNRDIVDRDIAVSHIT